MITAARYHGFSLLEITLVLLIVAVLAGSVLLPLGTQYSMKNVAAAKQQLEEMKRALLTYAILHQGFLPCTGELGDNCAPPPNGITNRELPARLLGINGRDPWGNDLIYIVSSNFARSATATTSSTEPMQLNKKPSENIQITEGEECNEEFLLTDENTVVFAIYSLGQNRQADGNNATPNSGCLQKRPQSRTVITTGTGSVAQSRDDILIWVPVSMYMATLIEAGALP